MSWELKMHYPDQSMADHLDKWNYPNEEWTTECLRANAFVCRIDKDHEVVGYVWFNHFPDSYRVFELHICIAQEHLRRWFSRKILESFYRIVRLLDGRHILLAHQNPKITERLKKHGWTVCHPLAFRSV